MDIALHLDPKSTISLQMQIYEQLAALIRKGGLKPGGVLPISRDPSTQLGVLRLPRRFIEAISAAPKNVDERSSKCRLF